MRKGREFSARNRVCKGKEVFESMLGSENGRDDRSWHSGEWVRAEAALESKNLIHLYQPAGVGCALKAMSRLCMI